jgi:pimeloyl-ACP methyl ester carboxylesterase
MIPTEDGVALSAWYFPAAEGAAYRDVAVVISHGNGGNISHRMGLYELLLGVGVHVLAYDYRGYGRSSGRASEEGTYRDGEAAVDWLVGRGFREGNRVAAELARRRPGLRGVILRSTFTSLMDLGGELFPFLPVRRLASIRYDTVSKLREIQVPVMILHSREDRLVRFSHAEANYAAAREPKWLREIGGDHNDQPQASPEAYAAAVRELLEATRGRGGE